jgi:hypothetical protein
MANRDTVKLLASIRLAIGAGSWLAPRLAGRAFGLDVPANPQAVYLARLFGVRDFALGWGVLTTQGEARRQWLMIGVACDAADALAGIAGKRDGSLPAFTSALVTSTAVSAVALGVGAVRSA